MVRLKQIRLSSNAVTSDTDYIMVNLWRDKVKVMRFTFCSPNCEYKGEHDYKFDGQVFYKNRGQV